MVLLSSILLSFTHADLMETFYWRMEQNWRKLSRLVLGIRVGFQINCQLVLRKLVRLKFLTLQVEASGIDIELRGGGCKNLFRDHPDPIFLHRKGWGIKIT